MKKLKSGIAAAAVALTCVTGTTLAKADGEPEPRSHSGTLPSGASWIADVPRRWNGTVILYSHGYGELVAQNAPDDETGARLLDEGYALVGSSYSGPSRWVLEHAVDDQFGSLAALEDEIGPPRRTIAWGVSMGGLVSALEAQEPRGRVDGALTTCGIVAGALNLNNVQLDGEHALARLLLPGQGVRLVGHETPEQAEATARTLRTATAEAQKTPQGRARIALAAALMNLPVWSPDEAAPPAPGDHTARQEQQYRILVDGRFAQFADGRRQTELAAGGNGSFNAGVDYRALLNGSVHADLVRHLYRRAGLDLAEDLAALTRDARVRAHPRAARHLARTSMATGRLAVPVLNLHTTADPIAPVENQNWYARKVAEAGSTRLLRQAYVRGGGHCAFEPAETIAALHALEHRLDTGRWDDAASPSRLNTAAAARGGTPRYTRFTAPRLTGALGEPGRTRDR
ncbi:alpha/beta hydrolase [Actinomadura sp. WMMB 499]|uniref:alpha/beta hydrolase n=1 Tax=Actinomadura sp. WMMB 499 TaxID=1219491 RepID=UPI001247F22B|nr:alpha/beta hydrolase [Actinomadura sp. WMMB 499]QFG24240.1 alpha/beta hydrolase [Actinomadura sp. WMMB 499]